jgi:coenzyme F420 hydrogenase subunit delta
MASDWYNKSILILGCGNVLFGDDGFGPAVAQCLLNNMAVPDDVGVVDAGTSVRNVLFDVILSDNKPSKIIIIDAMDGGREPGELFVVDIDSLPEVKIDDFSFHQLPTSNLLRELRDHCGVEVIIIACQVADIPEGVSPGLSGPVEKAVELAIEELGREHCTDFRLYNPEHAISDFSGHSGEASNDRRVWTRETVSRYRRMIPNAGT